MPSFPTIALSGVALFGAGAGLTTTFPGYTLGLFNAPSVIAARAGERVSVAATISMMPKSENTPVPQKVSERIGRGERMRPTEVNVVRTWTDPSRH